MEDTELLKRLKAGDKTAFTELVSIYASKVTNTCYRFFLDKQDAEDINQECNDEDKRELTAYQGVKQYKTYDLEYDNIGGVENRMPNFQRY